VVCGLYGLRAVLRPCSLHAVIQIGGNTLSDLKDADCDSGKRSLFLLIDLSRLEEGLLSFRRALRGPWNKVHPE